MYCPKCGQENNEENMYCTKCRNTFKQSDKPNQKPPDVSSDKLTPKPINIFTPVTKQKVNSDAIGILIFVVFIIVGIGLYINSIISKPIKTADTIIPTDYVYTTPEETYITTNEKSKKLSWNKVTEFNGDSTKTTKKFVVESSEWRVKWSTTPGKYGDMNFQIYLYNGDGTIKSVMANTSGTNNDESYVYESGEYYMMINTAQNYTITVEQNN